MRKKPEYKIIWVTPPDPVKLGTIMGEIYARGRGLEFVGLVPNEKKGEKALAIPPTPCAAALSRASTRSACASKRMGAPSTGFSSACRTSGSRKGVPKHET
jgi:hypothetical protein